MNILLTGASGFVGAPTAALLAACGHRLTLPRRRDGFDLESTSDFAPWLAGAEAVLHLAARAHVMNDDAADPLALFRRINRDSTIRLAEQAAAAGVRRFVFVSSIKAMGEGTTDGRPYRSDDAPCPVDPYGIAKWEAEQALAALAARTGMELVIIRPPLVHGPGAKGNLAALMRVMGKGLPLPLGAVTGNRRSLVGLANLADALRFCLEEPAAAGQTFLVRDGEDVSTAELLRRLARALGRPARLLPLPVPMMAAAAALLGKQAAMRRLTGSLCVDDTPLRALGWKPVQSLDQGLAAMAGQAQG